MSDEPFEIVNSFHFVIGNTTPAETPFQRQAEFFAARNAEALYGGAVGGGMLDAIVANVRGLWRNPTPREVFTTEDFPLPSRHKDWDRRFQCGAVWADDLGREYVLERECSSAAGSFMFSHTDPRTGQKLDDIPYRAYELDCEDPVMEFLRIGPPTSFLGHVKGIGVSAEPGPALYTSQDQYGDEDGL